VIALVVKHDADERAVNVHATAVVVKEAEVSEPIHEETDSRASCTDHFGERLLAHFRDERYRLGFRNRMLWARRNCMKNHVDD